MNQADPHISNDAAYASHNEVDGPHWPERCGHGGYVGTVWTDEIRRGPDGKLMEYREILDVYIFDSCVYGQEVCLRYGPEDHQYYSPGGLLDVLQRRHHPDAVKLILAKGSVRWQTK